jgi:hypothetical protein
MAKKIIILSVGWSHVAVQRYMEQHEEVELSALGMGKHYFSLWSTLVQLLSIFIGNRRDLNLFVGEYGSHRLQSTKQANKHNC